MTANAQAEGSLVNSYLNGLTTWKNQCDQDLPQQQAANHTEAVQFLTALRADLIKHIAVAQSGSNWLTDANAS